MNLNDDVDDAAFRADLRVWLAANEPRGLSELGSLSSLRDPEELLSAKQWSRALADGGYAGIMWPIEYGGRGASAQQQAILLEELAAAGYPQHLGVIGLNMVGPTIIDCGTPEQRQRYLPSMLSGDEIWCQGFSEPGAGSDLAGVRTQSEMRDDVVVINGQKVWSSFGHLADFCMLLTRSDAKSTRQRGLTCVIVDMSSPGVQVRALRELTGDAVFNEVFFDGVEVPPENILGGVGNGWQVAMTTLLHERSTLGAANGAALSFLLRRLLTETPRERFDALCRDRLARAWVDLQALGLLNKRMLSNAKGGTPGPEASAVKLAWSLQNQRLTKLAIDLAGPEATVVDWFWRFQQLRSRGNTIEAGTSEILRSVLAERVLASQGADDSWPSCSTTINLRCSRRSVVT